MKVKVSNVNQPQWKECNIHATLPAELSKLQELAYNLWWSWNADAKDLFRYIDNEAWHRADSNPVVLLNILSYDRMVELTKDAKFMKQLNDVYAEFRAYMDTPKDKKKPTIAYFSMEYGLSHVLKIYSGGLGILAGDYIKEASDCNVDMTAIGFLYRYGYFTQTLSPEGQQIANYEAQNFSNLPITQVKEKDGSNMIVEVPYPGRVVKAYLWQVAVGRMNLYLLDTDNELNSEWDRQITHQLYGGDWENRIKQEILLGIGGMLALKKLGIKKDVYHCNEGHAALMGLQRLVDLVQEEGLTFNQAKEIVRASGLYTCHTPVPAGHDYFEEGLFYKYMSEYAGKLGIEWHDLIGMGRVNPDDNTEKFSMSVFALNTCQEANNGVHMPTWAAHEWKDIYRKYLPKEWMSDQSNLEMWKPYNDIPDEVIWNTRMSLKRKMMDYIKEKFREDWMKTQGDPARIVRALNEMNPNNLIIGFGRRLQFLGKIIFLENYDMRLAKRLISGVDIWLNTPTRPLEASGTSGEKAQMNGVLNFSVKDGWWYEGYVEKAGWALTEHRTYENQAHQDQLDAATIYQMLESEIIPLYYAKNSKGFSSEWIQYIKNSVTKITPRFTMKRMIDDYFSKFYFKLAKRHNLLMADHYKVAKEIAAWKENIVEHWDEIEVVYKSENLQNLNVGDKVQIQVELDTHGLNDKGIGVELVAIRTSTHNNDKLYEVEPLKLVKSEGSHLFFENVYQLDYAGGMKFGLRMYPQNELLPHRMDFCYVRWI